MKTRKRKKELVADFITLPVEGLTRLDPAGALQSYGVSREFLFSKYYKW
jgi:hypothetical protein